jgi:tetratricopeptide (TPR) repeat protein
MLGLIKALMRRERMGNMRRCSQLKHLFAIVVFSFFMSLSFTAQARVLSGGVTEKKLARAVSKMLKKARKSYEKNKVKKAIDEYWKVLELDPQASIAYLELGSIYIELQIYDRAIELLEPGLEIAEDEIDDPDILCEHFCLLTNAYIETDQMGLASKSLIKAAQTAPKHPLPRKILGDIYVMKNRIKDAIKAYKKAIKLDPEFEPARIKLHELSEKHRAIFIASTAKTGSKKPKKKRRTRKPRKPAQKIKTAKTPKKLSPRPMPLPKPGKKPTKPQTSPKPEPRPMPLPKAAQSASSTAKTDIAKTTAQNESKEFIDPEREAELKQQKQEEALINTSMEANIDKLLVGNQDEKDEALEVLLTQGNKGIEAIEDLLYDSDPDVRLIAVNSLVKFKYHRKRVKEIIEDSVDDPDEDVKKAVEKALEELED